MTILFLHGWQSTPGGVKPTYLKDHGHEVLNPALPDDDFDAAVRIAQAEFDQHRPDVVVGSSRGGAVAMNINSGETPLVLLCPAWKRFGMATTVKPGTVIIHSGADDVVPFSDSVELVRNSGLPSESLIVVGHEHRMADPESLKAMVEACERASGPDSKWPHHLSFPTLPLPLRMPEPKQIVVTVTHPSQDHLEGLRLLLAELRDVPIKAVVFSSTCPRITVKTLITLGDKTKEGTLVKGVSALWFEIMRRIKADPDSIHQIGCWKWEELLAGAYKQDGWKPSS